MSALNALWRGDEAGCSSAWESSGGGACAAAIAAAAGSSKNAQSCDGSAAEVCVCTAMRKLVPVRARAHSLNFAVSGPQWVP